MKLFSYKTDGGELVNLPVCILTGRPIEAGDATFRISGTRFYYHVSAGALAQHTAEKREELIRLAGMANEFGEVPNSELVVKDEPVVTKPKSKRGSE